MRARLRGRIERSWRSKYYRLFGRSARGRAQNRAAWWLASGTNEDQSMSSATASASGTFNIGGDLPVTRLGFGAMRITGDGVWGEPADRASAIELLRALPGLGVDFIDTADSYGPHVSEELIREALHPYDGIVVATKAGLLRTGPNLWHPLGTPNYLRQCMHMSLRRLGVERIDLFQLHRIDANVDRTAQFELLADLQREGLVRHVGLSEVGVEEIAAAREIVEIATVQNLYNVANRQSEDVVDYCTEHGIGFIPWFPLAAGELARPGGAVAEVAERIGATSGQVALAWLLQRSPVMLPIPGTSSLAHLRENVAAADVVLSEADVALLDAAAPVG
jgi:aryl-alcohol dehydrogenase-like predicted oxidoreductase